MTWPVWDGFGAAWLSGFALIGATCEALEQLSSLGIRPRPIVTEL